MKHVLQIAAEELRQEIAEGREILLLDVRNLEQYEKERIEGPNIQSLHIPYFLFLEEKENDFPAIPKDREVTVVCCRGNSSQWVCQHLAEQGYTVRNLTGGMKCWNALQLV